MDPRWRDDIGPSGSSLNHPKFKRPWGFQRRYPTWQWGAVLFLIFVVHPVTVLATGSLGWGVGIYFAGIGLFILARYLIGRRERSARSTRREQDSLSPTRQTATHRPDRSLQDERDRLAAENARLKARLRQRERSE